MKRSSILIVHNFKPDELSVLDGMENLELRTIKAKTSEEVADTLNRHPDSEILYTIHTPKQWSSDWKLRWIQNHYAGADHLSLSVIPEHVEITTASGVNSIAIAEHVFLLIIALRRRLRDMLDLQQERSWPTSRDRWHAFARPLLRGNTIGILGYGSIGREIARMAAAFGMTVLACKRNPGDTEDRGFMIPGTGDREGSLPRAYYGTDGLYDMLSLSDIVVNTLPATPETLRLLDEGAFASMKPSVIFISVGRGRTVHQDALIKALDNGKISAAGLDVFDTEPLPPSSPLWTFKNVIISPHVSGFFEEYNKFAMILFRENLTRYLSGRPLLNRVDRNLGY